MKCNQWKQFKQQCENSCFRLTEMIHKKDIEFMDVGVIKEEESDEENNFDTANCGFDDGPHSSDSDEKEKLAEIVNELNPVCEIKEEFLNFELKNLNMNFKTRKNRVRNPNLIQPPMKMTVKKNTDLSKMELDQDDEINTIPKTENSSIAQPTRNLQTRKSAKRSYADDDDDGDNNTSGKDIDSDDDISYRKRPSLIYKCKTCRKRFSGCNLYEIHYVTAHMPNKEVSKIN